MEISLEFINLILEYFMAFFFLILGFYLIIYGNRNTTILGFSNLLLGVHTIIAIIEPYIRYTAIYNIILTLSLILGVILQAYFVILFFFQNSNKQQWINRIFLTINIFIIIYIIILTIYIHPMRSIEHWSSILILALIYIPVIIFSFYHFGLFLKLFYKKQITQRDNVQKGLFYVNTGIICLILDIILRFIIIIIPNLLIIIGMIFITFGYNKLGKDLNFLQTIGDLNQLRRIAYQSENEYRILVETSSNVIFRLNRTGDFDFVNENVNKILNYSKMDLIGRNFLGFVNLDDKPIAKSALESCLNGNFIKNTQIRIEKKNKEIIYGSINFSPVFDVDKSIIGIIGIIQDISTIIENKKIIENALTHEKIFTSFLKLALENISTQTYIEKSIEIWVKEFEIQFAFFGFIKEFKDLSREFYIFEGKSIKFEETFTEFDRSIIEKFKMLKIYCNNKLSLQFNRLEYRNSIFFPISNNQQCLGTLVLVPQEKRPFSDEDLNIIGKICVIISQALSIRYIQSNLEELIKIRNQELSRTIEDLNFEISERKKAEELLKDSILIAQKASEAKSQFLANMSHELRTPLNAIIGFSEILIDQKAGSLSKDQIEIISLLNESGRHLVDLVNQVLDLSKIEQGYIKLELSQFSINELLEEVIQSVASFANTKEMSLIREVEKEMNLHADRLRIKQILINIINNAIKFSHPQNRVIIKIFPKESSIVFEIIDFGIGMQSLDIERLFKPFNQIENVYSKKFQGTGLGLYYSKKLIELHRGTITVESKPNEGSKFTFILPT